MADRPRRSVTPRRQPLVPWVPPMRSGSRPVDGGALTGISEEEAARIASTDPIAARYLRPLVGADGQRPGSEEFCFWLTDARPQDLAASPELQRRIELVRDYRTKSKQERVRQGASRPERFLELRQPADSYLVSATRVADTSLYVPTVAVPGSFIARNSVHTVDSTDPLVVGVMNSRLYRLWAQASSPSSGGGQKLPPSLVYNTFPFPELSKKERKEFEMAVKFLMMSRTHHMETTMDALYSDPDKMPEQLKTAHQALDAVVANAFGLEEEWSDEDALDVLYERYESLVTGSGDEPPSEPFAA